MRRLSCTQHADPQRLLSTSLSHLWVRVCVGVQVPVSVCEYVSTFFMRVVIRRVYVYNEYGIVGCMLLMGVSVSLIFMHCSLLRSAHSHVSAPGRSHAPRLCVMTLRLYVVTPCLWVVTPCLFVMTPFLFVYPHCCNYVQVTSIFFKLRVATITAQELTRRALCLSLLTCLTH